MAALAIAARAVHVIVVSVTRRMPVLDRRQVQGLREILGRLLVLKDDFDAAMRSE